MPQEEGQEGEEEEMMKESACFGGVMEPAAVERAMESKEVKV